eukprot:12906477-Prorocentrum_lima.AAC.1
MADQGGGAQVPHQGYSERGDDEGHSHGQGQAHGRGQAHGPGHAHGPGQAHGQGQAHGEAGHQQHPQADQRFV